jgi:predicted transposase YdaD
MERFLKGPRLSFDCPILDVRELDSEPLLASSRLEDNVIAILTRLDNEREAVRRILAKIAMSEPGVRATAMSELMTLAGLRKLETVIERETEQMPILDDIMDHEVLGRERRRGIALGREKGLEEGLAEGLAKGLAKGEQQVVLRQIGKRFGQVPAWARKRIEALSGAALEQVGLRLPDASSLEELLG